MNARAVPFLAALIFVLSAAWPSAARAAADECVVLLHGLWRTERSMARLAQHLEEAGYAVNNVAYDSTDFTIEQLAEDAVPRALVGCGAADTVHFVTHSMGGILLRQYLEGHDIAQLGRVVMLAPPNQGSEVVDRYGKLPGFRWVSGPAGLQLGTGQDSIPRALGPVHFDLGIIAGTQSINPILSRSLPGADDGKVSVDATRVDGMNGHLQLPVTHMFMMRDDQVMDEVLAYLRNGRFDTGGSPAAPAPGPDAKAQAPEPEPDG